MLSSQRELERLVDALLAAEPAVAHACLLSEKLLRTLLTAAARHSEAGLHENVLRLITSLIFKNTPNQLYILKTGSLPSVLGLMERSPGVPGVQEYGCRAISSLALTTDGWTHSWRHACVDMIIKALRNCGEVTNVALHACASVCNLAATGEIQAYGMRVGILPSVVHAMDRNGSHPGIQDQGCRALRHLVGKTSEYHTAFIDSGAPVAIVRAMFMHWGTASVIEQACRALREVTRSGLTFKALQSATAAPAPGSRTSTPPTARRTVFSSPFKREASKGRPEADAQAGPPAIDVEKIPETETIVDAQIIYAVVRAMGAHPGSLPIQEAGISVLRFLSYRNPENQTTIARRGGVSALVAAMRGHLGSMSLQEEGCRLIANMLEYAALAPEILSSRTVQAVTAAQQAFPRSTHIEVCAHMVLRR